MRYFILLFKCQSLLYSLEELNSKFHILLEIPGLSFSYKQGNMVTLLQGWSYPPVENWFLVNALSNGVLGSLGNQQISGQLGIVHSLHVCIKNWVSISMVNNIFIKVTLALSYSSPRKSVIIMGQQKHSC